MIGKMRLIFLSKFQFLLIFSLCFIPYLAVTAEPSLKPDTHHSSSYSHVDIVEMVCKLTWPSPDDKPRYNSCVTTLQSVPKSHLSSLPNLAVISTRIAISDATTMVNYVQKLLLESSHSRTNGCLANCLWFYRDSIAGMMSSIQQIRKAQYGNASATLSAILDDVFGCDLCFQGSGTEDPLMKRNEELFDIIRIGATISYTLASV